MSGPFLQNPSAPSATPTFEALYRAKLPYVCRTLQRLGVPARDVEDLAHEVFLVVRERLPDYKPHGQITAWLAAIAYNFALRYHQLKRTQSEELVEVLLDESDRAPSPEGHSIHAERRELILDLLDAIPADRRIVLIMHEIDGISLRDIARALGLHKNTAKRRLQLAKRDFIAAARRRSEAERGLLDTNNLSILPLVLDPEELLAAERRIPALPGGIAARMWNRLRSTVAGTGDGPSLSSAVFLPYHPPAPRSSSLLQLSAAFVLGAGVGALILWTLLRSPPSPPLTPVAEPASNLAVYRPSPAPPRSDASAAQSPPPAAPIISMERAIASPAASRPADFVAEQKLISQARAAIDKDDRVQARAALVQHKRLYPRGVLAQKRENLLRLLDKAAKGQP